MKPTYRIIIEHINHNPHERDVPDKLNEEFVVLENEGTEKISLAGWTLTDETATGVRRHIYEFRQLVSLSSREKAYVHTGSGEDSFEEGKPSSGSYTGEDMLSSGTTKGIPPHFLTLKETK